MRPNEGVQGVVPGLDPSILKMKPLNHRPSRASIPQGTQQTDSSRQDSILEMIERIQTERDLVALALQLGAEQVAGWSPEEKALTSRIPSPKGDLIEWAAKLIRRGEDPLGWAFCRLRTPEVRRAQGATYTPTTPLS